MGHSEGRPTCIIHFDRKFEPQKRLSNETLKTICLRREEWLALPDECHDNQKNIANQSFEFIPDLVKDIQELQEPAILSHVLLSKFFTYVTKLQPAKNYIEKRISAGLTQNIKPENEDTEDSGPKR
ncbi:Hypothetical predicted protein [Paramuricea clavata]|uniref:Uncharacterized protein n=1 Tax=Paramuricea clavata TaxID=317549 RepID=A0A6S7KK71_PARCT|nr:Hypothetical predicted protein [Paramuricea clavata]